MRDAFKPLTKWWKEAIKDTSIQDVKVSKRLASTPCVVVAGKVGAGAGGLGVGVSAGEGLGLYASNGGLVKAGGGGVPRGGQSPQPADALAAAGFICRRYLCIAPKRVP